MANPTNPTNPTGSGSTRGNTPNPRAGQRTDPRTGTASPDFGSNVRGDAARAGEAGRPLASAGSTIARPGTVTRRSGEPRPASPGTRDARTSPQDQAGLGRSGATVDRRDAAGRMPGEVGYTGAANPYGTEGRVDPAYSGAPTTARGRGTREADDKKKAAREYGERETELRNEAATNVTGKTFTPREGMIAPALQHAAKRIDGLVARLCEVPPPQEIERVRGLLKVETDYLRSIGKSDDDFIPEPPREPKLRM